LVKVAWILEPVLAPLQQRRERRLRDDRVREADLQDDQEWRQEEQQQPEVRECHRALEPAQ
jgi:hypothetical protein